MRVFITGATGFIGSAVVRELLDSGHHVLGLARSDASAAALQAVGAEAHYGALDDLDSLRRGATAADGVIHTAWVQDLSDMTRSAATDLRAIEAMGEALQGSGRPLVTTSGVAALPAGRLSTEDDDLEQVWGRAAAEAAALALADRDVRTSVVRPAPASTARETRASSRPWWPPPASTAARPTSTTARTGGPRWPWSMPPTCTA
jgi:nucleoside-diphosphate-sugar epimerase